MKAHGKTCNGTGCNLEHSSTFDKSLDYTVDNVEIKDSNELILEESCNLLEPHYIGSHLKTAILFVISMSVFGIIITALHELMHVTFYIWFGYPIKGISISVSSGQVISNIPENASVWWYVLAMMGPSLFIEGSILLILLIFTKYETKYAFLDGTMSNKSSVGLIRKSIGWFAAFKILSMIVFFPVLNAIYRLISIKRTTDLVIAWNYISRSADPLGVFAAQIVICLMAGYLLALSGLYIYATKKTASAT